LALVLALVQLEDVPHLAELLQVAVVVVVPLGNCQNLVSLAVLVVVTKPILLQKEALALVVHKAAAVHQIILFQDAHKAVLLVEVDAPHILMAEMV